LSAMSSLYTHNPTESAPPRKEPVLDLPKDILEPLLQELRHDIPRERILIISHPRALFHEDDLQIQGNRGPARTEKSMDWVSDCPWSKEL
jgi:hypothetical protein